MTTISHISHTPYVTPSETDAISRSVTAVSGDIIYVGIAWRKTGTPISMGAMSWNGQTLAKYGPTIDTGEARIETHWVQASASATANLTATLTASQHYVIIVSIARPSALATVSAAGVVDDDFLSGTYVDPSLSMASVPADSFAVSYLNNMGWDTGYGDLTVTLAPDAPFGDLGGDTNTNYRGVWALQVAVDEVTSGTVTSDWTRSNSEEPMYANRLFYFSAAPSASIDTVTTDGNPGLVIGEDFEITTTGLSGSALSIVVETDAMPTATVSTNSLSGIGNMPFWVDDEYSPFPGSVVVTATDVTPINATGAFTLSLPANYLSQVFSGIIISDATYLGAALLAISRPLADGDAGYWPDVNSLVFSAVTKISLALAPGGTMTTDLWIQKVDGKMEYYSVTINDVGEITDATRITSRAITSRAITSRNITSRSIT